MKKNNILITNTLVLLATTIPGIINAMDKWHPCPFPTHLWGNVTLSSTQIRSHLGQLREMPEVNTMPLRIEQLQSTYDGCREHVSPAEYNQIGCYLIALKRANERIHMAKPGISPTVSLDQIQQSAAEQQSACRLLHKCMQNIRNGITHGTNEEKITDTNTKQLHRTRSRCTLDDLDDEEYPLGCC